MRNTESSRTRRDTSSRVSIIRRVHMYGYVPRTPFLFTRFFLSKKKKKGGSFGLDKNETIRSIASKPERAPSSSSSSSSSLSSSSSSSARPRACRRPSSSGTALFFSPDAAARRPRPRSRPLFLALVHQTRALHRGQM